MPWPVPSPPRCTAGFESLRRQLSLNVAARLECPVLEPATRWEIDRIFALWREARERFAGDAPFLFGAFSVADAFYAPVVSRFATYGIELPEDIQPWADAILSMPEMREWTAAAKREVETEPAAMPPPRVPRAD